MSLMSVFSPQQHDSANNMAQICPPGSILIANWHQSQDSKEYFSKILHKKRRRKFGLLESPTMPPHLAVDTVRYKVFMCGRSGVGKTALAARLAGVRSPNLHYETKGMETTVVYWPAKLRESGKVLFFCLQLWDCGENALRRFDHFLPSCQEQVDAVLFLFSFTDKTSFDELPNQIRRWSDTSVGAVVKVVVGTKFDLFMHCDVTAGDVKDFEQTWSLPLVRQGGEVSDGLADVAPLLNCLAENLWHQDCVAAAAPGIHSSQQETEALV